MPAQITLSSTSLRGPLEAQSRGGSRVGRDIAALPDGDAEASGIIPHRPTDVVMFKRRANVFYPAQACLRGRISAKDSELVTHERHVMFLPPGGGKRDGSLHMLGIPALFPVSFQRSLCRLLFDGGQGGNSFGAGGIRNVFDVGPVV